MIDLFGPASFDGAVTTRPTDNRSFGSTDTWFRDCSDPSLDDGTEFGAAFFNAVLANMRAVARANGLTGGGSEVVTQDNADDNMILRAITNLIQRGQPQYADDTGADGSIIVTLSPVPKEYKKGMVIVTKAAASNSGATTLNANGLGAVPVLRQDGTALNPGDILAGGMFAFSYDGTAFQIVWQNKTSILLSVPTDYYVNATTGSDANDGASATVGTGHRGPFATLQRAAKAAGQWILNGVNITIHVADGSYGPLNAPRMSGSGSVNWIGNSANPAAVVVTGAGVHAIQAQGNYHTFDGFKVQTTGAGSGLAAITNSSITARNIEYGACAGAQNLATYTSTIRLGGALRVTGGSAGYVGNAGSFAYANNSGTIELIHSINPNSLTLVGTPNYGQAFCYSYGLSQCTMNFGSITGSATGAKYFATIASVINTLGGGASYLPGNSAGGVTDTSYYG
ncbi:MAG: hypothetical protein ACOY3N_23215 [Bradyrhizobium sp.]|uniref:hypothetical protein n=1 Tax=Bradyrhizobium sp. TaxID=376 RepID=UPI003BF3748B